MQTYKDLLQDILDNGLDRGDRTGTGTRSVFGRQIRFNLAEGFPILTTKIVAFKRVVAELMWFLSGSTDNNLLAQFEGRDADKTLWAEWAHESGDLGPIYGKQWRSWEIPSDFPEGRYIDQVAEVIKQIRRNPNSRRLIVSAWNPAVLPDESVSPQLNVAAGKAALPPCHTLFQFYVVDGKLSCQLYQRSGDFFLGVPFNIASYSLLTHIIAQQCHLEVGEFIHTFGDLHLYHNHFEQAQELLDREPRQLPKLRIKRWASSFDKYNPDDFELVGYNPHAYIHAPVSV